MPIFYNTAAPTPSTKNNINDIAVTYGIRDFLLNLNLLPFYPQISTAINGSPQIGQPVLDTSINGNANVIPNGLPLEVQGLLYYEMTTIQNQFQNNDTNAPSLVNIEDIPTTQGIFGNIDFDNGSTYPTSATDEITELGLLGKTNYAEFRTTNTLYNLYVDTAKQIDMADFISLQPIGYPNQFSDYYEVFGGLQNGTEQTFNVIGSVLNGQGLGIANDGIVPNFDFRASIAGRTLTGLGLANDTRLGVIGGQQLALALANNAAFNVQQDILGGLNTQDNLLALIQGGPLPGLRPNYKITVPQSDLGRVFDYASSVLGFTLPRSFVSDDGSIFLSESDSANIERANALILNTGKGQVEALISNVFASVNGTTEYDNPNNTPFRSGYVPGYRNNRGDNAINANLYAFYNSDGETIYNFLTNNDVIPEISYNRSEMIKSYGFVSPNVTNTLSSDIKNLNLGYENRSVSNVGFTWTSDRGDDVNTAYYRDNTTERAVTLGAIILPEDEEFNPKKSLLTKTQKLFKSKGMMTIVSSKGTMDKTSSQLETTNGGGISKGSAVLRGDRFSADGLFDGQKSNAVETYCRSWTTLDRYDQVQKLVRSRGLYEGDEVPYRVQTNGSILDDNGFVKIGPYNSARSGVEDPKKYMLSIENMAWSDDIGNLPPYEVGPGDLITGKKGRIMWFPPYDIQINETSAVNWEKNDFIGRGESIYTYNNTERSGTLSFKIIVDHPTYVNSFGKQTSSPDDNYVASFFAGCLDANPAFTERLTVTELSEVSSRRVTENQSKTLEPQTPPDTFSIYFPNDSPSLETIINGLNVDGVLRKYESGLFSGTTPIFYTLNPTGLALGIGSYVGGVTSDTPWNDLSNFGLNGKQKQSFKVGLQEFSGLTDSGFMPALKTYLETQCPYCKITVTSFASPHGNLASNQELAKQRTETVVKYLRKNLGLDQNRIVSGENKAIQATQTDCNPAPTDVNRSSEACKKDRRTKIEFTYDEELATADPQNGPTPVEVAVENTTVNTKITNRFYNETNWFEKLTQTDKFVFDTFREKIKYFHPAFHSTTPEGLNSRLTFLNQCTRQGSTSELQGANNLAFGRAPVCILRVGDFYNTKIVIDNLSIDYEPLVWDLNPEGIGVQPMIANVTLSFKFLGGSSLAGPINRLQNALSFNYYANTHVYDVRADYIKDNALVDGQKSLSGAVTQESSTVINVTPIENQIAANNNVIFGPVNITTVDPTQTGTTEPKILGFSFISITPTSEPNVFNYSVGLKQEGIGELSGNTFNVLLSDFDFNTFVNKSVKINYVKSSEMVDNTDVFLDAFKFLASIDGNGYKDEAVGVSGNYQFSIFYNGEKIQTIPVIFDPNNQFNRTF
jgi:hypothetical protein